MSTTTPNLGLTKPAGSEAADVAVINGNMDLLDTAVAAKAPSTAPTLTNAVLNGSLSGTATVATAMLAANAATQSGTAQSSSASTSSAVLADITGLTVTLTTTGGTVLLFAHVNFSNGTAGNATSFAVLVDGVNVNNVAKITAPGNGYETVASFATSLGALGAGSHTVKLQWAASAGTSSLTAGINSELVVVELKR